MNKYKSAYARSNNTNKLSPQEQNLMQYLQTFVQIIQINLVLKNKQVSLDEGKEFK